ncbi:MAG: hypothetical protein ACTSPI_13755, partial [Candidatus Heimdallarchaeaceae archaeon]
MSYSLEKQRKEILFEAQKILKDDVKYFKSLITEYNIYPKTPKWDLACFSLYRTIFNNRKKNSEWINFWKKTSEIRDFGNLRYQVFAVYKQFLYDEPSSNELLALLKKENIQGLTNNWEIFLQYFFLLRSNIRPTFSRTEYDVFQAILQKQTTSLTVLSEYLKKDRANIYRYKKMLE